MTDDFRPTLSIDLGAIADNWRALNARSAGGSAAVIKADAYGLGAADCGPALLAAGADRFFVATLDEGRRLRAILVDALIGVLEGLSDPSPSPASADARAQHTGAGAGLSQARDSLPTELVVHVDTGMNRLGLSPEAAAALFDGEVWRSASRRLLMSHLAEAEDPSAPSNRSQLAAFTAAMEQAGSGAGGFTASLINSSGHFLGEDFCRIGLGRPGVALYGANPCPGAPHPLTPVVSLQAPLIQVRRVPAGSPVGYGGTWTTVRESVLGVLALGYADGWPGGLRPCFSRHRRPRGGAGWPGFHGYGGARPDRFADRVAAGWRAGHRYRPGSTAGALCRGRRHHQLRNPDQPFAPGEKGLSQRVDHPKRRTRTTAAQWLG